MPETTYSSRFRIGDSVYIGDESLVATVTALLFRDDARKQCEVTYVHNGEIKTAWIPSFMLNLAAPVRQIFHEKD